jgi:glycosyltransferase involved in cell wall biosynthesis
MPCATLRELPPAPAGRTGWPWDAESPPPPPLMPDGRAWPTLTVVTPSYNQGRFIEETIRSVLLQGYPALEYVIIDGGSRDQTIDVVRRYARFIDHWVSEKDSGQADALNKGFRRAGGNWVGWQNSDDYYARDAFAAAARAAAEHSEASVIYGSVELCDGGSRITGSYPTGPFDLQKMFPWANMFNQSMFFHGRVFDAGIFLDENLKHYVDHDFFWRLILADFKFHYVPELSAVFRIHDEAKGATQQEIAAAELHALYRRLFQDGRLPASVRRRALESMRAHCVDQFGKSRWKLFEQFSTDLRRIAGWRGMGVNLTMRRAMTRLGVSNIERVRRLKRLVRSRPAGAT